MRWIWITSGFQHRQNRLMGGPPRGPGWLASCKKHPCEKFLIWKNINIFKKNWLMFFFSWSYFSFFFFVGGGGGEFATLPCFHAIVALPFSGWVSVLGFILGWIQASWVGSRKIIQSSNETHSSRGLFSNKYPFSHNHGSKNNNPHFKWGIYFPLSWLCEDENF